jgi:hypothetical protein
LKKANANILSMLLLFVLVGCNLPKGAAPEPGGATPTAVFEPLPSGYVDLLQEKIASGEWTLEIGLVTLLKLFAGEIPVGKAGLGEGVLEREGTGILRLASAYLQTGTDQATKDEISRLVNIIIPSREALDRYSIPEEQATIRSGRGAGLAAPVRPDAQADCAGLWANGYAIMNAPHLPCFLFRKLVISGNDYLVYFPLAWHADHSRDIYYAATLAAVQDSIDKFKSFGEMIPIYFVFYPLDDPSGHGALASTFASDFTPGLDACPVIIYPDAMGAALGDEEGVNKFKQAIAHEIFHCFQAWNLSDPFYGPGTDSDWWVEGTAQYFSNLVYPAANMEQEWTNNFSRRSTVKPLTSMSYQNFAFFQFLGNRIGPERVLEMIETMPTTPGLDLQIAALAAVPGMEATFEEFARSVLDGTLEDSDGKKITFPEYFTAEFPFTDLISRAFPSHLPFVLSRYRVTFAGQRQFSVSSISTGVGSSGVRVIETPGSWAPIPASIGGCDELAYVLYVITTNPGVVERIETITTTEVNETPCDECLIGKWEATNDSVQTYMQSVISAGGEDVPTVKSVTGTMFLEFGANGLGYGGYRNLKVHETGVGAVAGSETIVTFEGFSSGPYTADGSALIGLSGTTDVIVTVEILVNGVSFGSSNIPLRPEDFPVSSTLPTRYTCGVDVLFTWPPVEGVTVEPIMFQRISP